MTALYSPVTEGYEVLWAAASTPCAFMSDGYCITHKRFCEPPVTHTRDEEREADRAAGMHFPADGRGWPNV